MLTGGNAICIEHVPDLPLMNCLECIGSVSLVWAAKEQARVILSQSWLRSGGWSLS